MNKKKMLPIEYRRYVLPSSFPVVLIDGPTWRISDIPSDRLHFHNCMEIGICHSNSGTLEVMSEPFAFQEGDVTVVPRNVPHTMYSDEGHLSLWSFIFFSPSALFKGALFSSFTELGISKSSLSDFKCVLGEKEFPEIHMLAAMTLAELRKKDKDWQAVVRSLLFSLYVKLQRIERMDGFVSETKNLEEIPTVIKAVDYIEDHYAEKLSIEDLADHCCISTSHFRRLFFSAMNISPLMYLNSIRITKACSLLISTSDTILQIAEDVGFFSVANFNRNFKAIMHVTPKVYKQSVNHDVTVVPDIVELAGWTQPEKPKKRSDRTK